MLIRKILIIILGSSLFCGYFSFAGEWNQSPSNIIGDLKNDNIQETALNNAGTDHAGISSTLESIKEDSSGYIQWLGFIGLSIALVLIIYNGIVLLTNFGSEDNIGKVKKRFISLIIGVIILTSGYIIIKFIVSLLGGIFN